MEWAAADNLRNSIENQNYLRFISKINSLLPSIQTYSNRSLKLKYVFFRCKKGH